MQPEHPTAPICSHSPDAVPIDSSVHQVLFKCGLPSFRWMTSGVCSESQTPQLLKEDMSLKSIRKGSN